MLRPLSRPKMPPLNALRAFEAAARLGSFTAAANELCVTPGAVAQHVKALEAWAGQHLFDRHPQGVRLTRLGRGVLPEFTAAFDHLGEAVQSLSRQASPQLVRIAALPSIAHFWLSPRLPAIRRLEPAVEVSVTALDLPPNLRRAPYDLSIFFEAPEDSPLKTRVCRDEIFPVCAPAVAARLRSPSDLAGETLLHDAAWSADWADWLAAVAPELSLNTDGPAFSLFSLAVEEARNGAGVLIGHGPLVDRLLASGALAAPFPERVARHRQLTITAARSVDSDSPLGRVISALADPS